MITEIEKRKEKRGETSLQYKGLPNAWKKWTEICFNGIQETKEDMAKI